MPEIFEKNENNIQENLTREEYVSYLWLNFVKNLNNEELQLLRSLIDLGSKEINSLWDNLDVVPKNSTQTNLLLQLRDEYFAKQRTLLLGALTNNNWSLTKTAEELGSCKASVHTLIRRHHPTLKTELSKKAKHGGRPRKNQSSTDHSQNHPIDDKNFSDTNIKDQPQTIKLAEPQEKPIHNMKQLKKEYYEKVRVSIQAALEKHGWSLTKAAEELGIRKETLHTKMRRNFPKLSVELSKRASRGGRPRKIK